MIGERRVMGALDSNGREIPLTSVEREMLEAIEQKLRDNPKLQYHEALKLVASERRDLARRYRAAALGLFTGRD